MRREVNAAMTKAVAAGVCHRNASMLLIHESIATALEGDIQLAFDHGLILQIEGKKMLTEFENRFGDRLDFDELNKGNGAVSKEGVSLPL